MYYVFWKHNFYQTRLANWYISKSIEHILHVTYNSSFHMGKGIHDPNDPLLFSCMLGFLGCEMCLFQKLYVEGFVNSFAAIVFHLIGLELIIVIVFLHQLIRITMQLPIHTLHFCLLLCLLEEGFLFPL